MTLSLYRDKEYNELVATSTVSISDTSFETPEFPPTLSPVPTSKQPTWGGGVDGGSWFTLSPGRAEYNRGEEIGVRIDSDSLPGTKLIWRLSGENISADAIEPSEKHSGFSGKQTIGLNGISQFNLTFKPDNQTKDDSEITFELYREDDVNKILAKTSLILAATPAEAIQNKTQIDEGKEMKFKIFTKGLAEGDTVYWDLTGENITEGDFETPISGSTTLDSTRKFQVRFETRKDLLTEGTEYFHLNMYSDEAKINLMDSSGEVTIFDTSTAIPAEAIPNKIQIDEGKEMKFKIFTKGLAEGDTVYWDLTGENITEGDFETPISGSTTLDSTRKFQVRFETRKDLLTEGTEYFHLNMYSDEAKINLMDSSGEVTIFDTSTAIPAEAIPNKIQIDEGKEMKFKIFTKGLAEGDTVYWDLSGQNITDGDFETPISGSTTLDSTRKFQIRFHAKNDSLTEGTEDFQLNIYTDISKSKLIASSKEIDILDKSTTPIKIYNVESNYSAVQKGKGFKVKVKTKNIPNDDIIYWKGYGSAVDRNIVELENSNSMNGIIPLDSKGSSVLQFRTNNQDFYQSGLTEFKFGLYENENFLQPISNQVEVLIFD